MVLKEYIKNLTEFAEANPECLELDVITSRDDEGNGFNKIYYTPTKGIFDGSRNGDFQTRTEECNAVCVN